MGMVSELLWKYLESPYIRIKAESALTSDAIVVLSGSRHPAPGKSKILEWTDPDRFLAGIKLFEKGNAPNLIFTGGYNPYDPGVKGEGEYYSKEAKKLGIPSSSIKKTGPVSNTLEEAYEVNILLNNINEIKNNPIRITLVTSAFHMKRAKKLFERQGLKVEPFPVDFKSKGLWAGKTWKNPLSWYPNANNLAASSRAIRELMGRIFYRSW